MHPPQYLEGKFRSVIAVQVENEGSQSMLSSESIQKNLIFQPRLGNDTSLLLQITGIVLRTRGLNPARVNRINSAKDDEYRVFPIAPQRMQMSRCLWQIFERNYRNIHGRPSPVVHRYSNETRDGYSRWFQARVCWGGAETPRHVSVTPIPVLV